MSYEQLTNKFEEDILKTLRLLIKIFTPYYNDTLYYNEKELRQNSEKSFILPKNINYVMPILKKHGFDFIDFDYCNQTSKLKYISRHGYGLLSVTDMANATAIGVTLGISFNSKPYKFTSDEIKQILRNKTNEDIINFSKNKNLIML